MSDRRIDTVQFQDKPPIETDGLERIAFATSRTDPAEQVRWTELSLFYRPEGIRPTHPGRKFMSQSVGKTCVPGEQEFVRQRVVKSIEQALRLFDNSRLHDQIVEQADAWRDRNPQAEDQPSRSRRQPEIQFDGAGGLRGALLWLYPAAERDSSDVHLAKLFQFDWGVPVRTVTHALAQEKGGDGLPSWCKAFIGSLMHFDRDAFHAMRRA